MKRRQFVQSISSASALSAMGLIVGARVALATRGPKSSSSVGAMGVQPLPSTSACGQITEFRLRW
jgi:hypothetical protein